MNQAQAGGEARSGCCQPSMSWMCGGVPGREQVTAGGGTICQGRAGPGDSLAGCAVELRETKVVEPGGQYRSWQSSDKDQVGQSRLSGPGRLGVPGSEGHADGRRQEAG